MLVEKRTYTLYPGKAAEYMKNYRELGLEIQLRILGNLVGWYTTEIGSNINQIVHMWAYQDLNDRAKRRAELAKNPDWTQKYLPSIRPLVMSQESCILVPAPWSPWADGPPGK